MSSTAEPSANLETSIVYITSDLMFSSRAIHAAGQSGIGLQVAADLQTALEACAANQVALLLIDLTTPGIEPANCIEEIHRLTNRPGKIIAYGPHVHEAKLTAAAAAGCDEVMSRGQFHTCLEQLVETVSNTG